MRECLELKDNVFPQYLLFAQLAHRAAEKISRAIPAGTGGRSVLKPILAPYDTVGSTRYVEFDTVKGTWPTKPDKSHVSHVVLDSNWEAKLAQSLEAMPEVASYVKNQRLGFTIPYAVDGQQHSYLPDYIVRLDDGHGQGDLLNLVVEVTGEKDVDKEAKVATARDLWVPAVNHEGAFGRWAFLEIQDPWSCQKEIRDRWLLERLRRGHQRNVAFSDFCRLIEAFGFRLQRIRGSHHHYFHPAAPMVITIQPQRGQAKPYQIRQFLKRVDRYNLRLEDEP